MEPAASASPISGRENVVPRVGYLIYRVERRLKVRLNDAVRAEGVTTTEYVTLAFCAIGTAFRAPSWRGGRSSPRRR